MESLIHKERRKSQRIPVELVLVGEIEGHQVAMYSTNISLDGMFVQAREFIRPCTGFFAQAWLPTSPEPLHVYLTTSLFEQTWAGYGIGVHLAGISPADRAIWENYYHRCAAAHGEPRKSAVPERLRTERRILVIAGAVPPLAMQALRRQGLLVSEVESVEQAIEISRQESVDVIVSELRRPGLDGLALCCYVNSYGLATRTLVVTDSSTQKEFLLGLFAGATRVIARSASTDMLIGCVMDVIQQPLASRRPSLFGSPGQISCAG